MPQVLDAQDIEALKQRVTPGGGASAGTRGLLNQAWCQALAQRLLAHPVLARLVPEGHRAVQCTYFEKSAERNWLVSFHQDLSIPVAGKVAAEGLGPWSEKEGALFVQAPAALLDRMVALRLHLDVCAAADGALRVLPGSHAEGVLPANRVAHWRAVQPEHVCESGIGGVLALRPLLLHASSKSSGKSRRRVLHFLFGPAALPHGLAWPATTN